MEFGGRVSGLGIEALNLSNYSMWKSCMESCIRSEGLWEIVVGTEVAPTPVTGTNGTVTNADAVKEW